MRSAAAWIVAAAIFAGCASPTTSDRTARAPHAAEPYFLTNGLLGVRIGPDGNAVGPWFLADGYTRAPEERLAPIDVSRIPAWNAGRPLRAAPFPRTHARRLELIDAQTGLTVVTWWLDEGRPRAIRAVTTGREPRWTTVTVTSADKPPVLETARASDGAPPEVATGAIRLVGPAGDAAAIARMEDTVAAAVAPGVQTPPGPFGLSDPKFDGHVFWDADLWLFPALMLTHPDRARVVPAYRLRMAGPARANFAAWRQSGEPTAVGPVPDPLPERATVTGGPLKYPWQSAVTGQEVAPGETRFQEHVTGSVAWGLRWAAALGLAEPERVDEVVRGAAAYYVWRASAEGPADYGLRGVMSPDEWHVGDHDLYTNLLADTLIRAAFPRSLARRVVVPSDAQGLLNYEGDLVRAYQQAAGLLAVFPLQHPAAEAEAVRMVERFGPRSTPNGPAMSLSLEALVLARFGDAEDALSRWRESWGRYTTGETGLFSERPGTGETYFLTGAAGCLNAVVYGFMGLRLDPSVPADAPWRRRLRSGWWISARPNLPAAWESLTVELNLDGQSVRLQAAGRTVTASPSTQQ